MSFSVHQSPAQSASLSMPIRAVIFRLESVLEFHAAQCSSLRLFVAFCVDCISATDAGVKFLWQFFAFIALSIAGFKCVKYDFKRNWLKHQT